MTNKKLTKKIIKFEKKHPNLTAACIYYTAASVTLSVVCGLIETVTAVKTLKHVRMDDEENNNENNEDENTDNDENNKQ